MFIRELRLTEWNPIGATGLPDDEYEAYAMEALGIIVKGGNVDDVIELLWRSETEHMSLRGNRPRAEAVGHKLDASVRRIVGI